MNELSNLQNGIWALRPWLDSDGNILPDTELTAISRGWDADVWERFLRATVDREPTENVITNYSSLIEERPAPQPNFCDSTPEDVAREIHRALKSLTRFQRTVVRSLFFDELSQRHTARRLRVAQQSVNRAKRISLQRIKALLETTVVVSDYLIRGAENSQPQKWSPEDEWIEVYLADLKGSYLK